MPLKLQLLILTASISIIALIAGGIWMWRKRSRVTRLQLASELEEKSRSSPKDFEKSLLINSQTETSRKVILDGLNDLSSKIWDVEVRNYLEEVVGRICQEGQSFNKDTPMGVIEEMVDHIDAIAAMNRNLNEQSSSALSTLSQSIVSILAESGAQLIQSSTWDSAIQRAIAKEPTEGIESPVILRFGSTGILRHGELIRKQEVILGIPMPK